MNAQYFVKFIGEKHVTVATASSAAQAAILKQNAFENCTAEFYEWVRSNTQLLEARRPASTH